MPTQAFTDRWLRHVRADARIEYTDAGCPGLRLRVGPRQKTFYVARKEGSRFVRRRIGDYPVVSLQEARAAALAPQPVEVARTATFANLVDFRLAQLEARGSDETRNYLTYLRRGAFAAEKHFGPDTPAADIKPEHVVAWLRTIIQAGVNTRLPRAYLSATFTAARKADLDPASEHPIRFGVRENPVALVGGATKVKPRDRVLSLDEVKVLWNEFKGRQIAVTTAVVLKAIIATGGLRVSEILWLRREHFREMDGEPWIVLPETKNGRSHAIPLPKAAVALFDTVRGMVDTDHLFPARLGSAPTRPWHSRPSVKPSAGGPTPIRRCNRFNRATCAGR